MRIDEYITSLRKDNDIIMTMEKGEIKIKAPKAALTNEIIKEIRGRKDELILFFKKIENDNKSFVIPIVPKKKHYKLSSVQKRLYFLYEFDPDSLAYNTPKMVELVGEVDKERLNNVFKKLVTRHDILRTSFEITSDGPVQIIEENIDFEISHYKSDRSHLDNEINNFIRPFNLNEGALLRIALFEIGPSNHVLAIDMHHIITDGVSSDILTSDFIKLYNNEALPEIKVQYKDYSEWQQSLEQQEHLLRNKGFWMEAFSEEPERLSLPTDYSRPQIKSFEGDSISVTIGTEYTIRLKELAEKEGSTMFMVLMTICNVLFGKLGNQDDVVIGTPTAGRRHVDLERMLGMFVNTLPIRNYPKSDLRFKEFLSKVKATTLACFENQDYPYEQLIDDLNVSRDSSHNPLFDIMFAYQNFEQKELEIPGLKLKPYNSGHIISEFDIHLSAYESMNELFIRWDYAKALFKRDTIERFICYFNKVVASVIGNPDIKISEIDVLQETEKQQLLEEFNNTDAAYPKEKTIVDLFDEQVVRTPENIAVRFSGGTMTYKTLKERSDRFAHYLNKVKGVGAGDLVGVMLDRGEHLIPVIYGILKTGAAYIPIDPNFPEERINIIVKDSNPKVLITLEEDISYSAFFETITINLYDKIDGIYKQKISSEKIEIDSKALAYVIYTSGSTGKPKGVMIEHHSVINRILWMQKQYPIFEKDVLLQKTPIVFDVSVWELFWWSFTGASLCLLKPGEEKEPEAIFKTIEQNNVSVMHFVPPMFNAFLSSLEDDFDYATLKSLRTIFSSGEALKPEHATLFKNTIHKNCKTKLINLYGPTEATVDVSYYECDTDQDASIIPIGKPIDNIQLYILNKDEQAVPIGVSGELYIAGVGLARGYLNNEELTAEKFVKNKFHPNQKMYKTGDLARYLPDGNIEYLGRIDNQIKLRGFRIELGEIENQLLSHDLINEAIVLEKGEGIDKYLVAYYMADDEIEFIQLRSHLLNILPEYMIPSYFVHLDSLPLTVNGKINRNKLPEPQVSEKQYYELPESDIENQILLMWKAVLLRDKIGTNEDFFLIGGNSLKLIQLFKLINDFYPSAVKVRNLFENRTIKEIAKCIQDSKKQEQGQEQEQEQEKKNKVIIEF